MDKNFRLATDVRPQRYLAELTPDLKAGTFAGHLTIELTLTRPSRAILLHAIDLDLANVTANADGKALRAMSVTAHAESETVEIAFDSDLPAGPAKLDFLFSGKFFPGLRGLYRAGTLAVTQFEAADARRVFPCFDEPSFKASWALTLNVPEGATAIANGHVIKESVKAGMRTVHFAETPLMSSYLVALIVGDLASSAPVMARKVELRSWAVPGKVALTGFAQTCAGATVPLLEDYFGVPYAFGKLDQIAVPNFEAGAMENAGAITFREVVLLVDEKTASLAQKKRVAEVITHEAAHQWFGNLVTMVWWDDLWLNEAFATWMAYKIVDQWKPAWRVWMEFEMGKGSALALDALESTHPIRAEVKNAMEASENFDAITYEKGGAVLRMLEGYLGADRFRDGVRRYIKAHAWGNATNADLWRALQEASGEPIAEVAGQWISTAGFPVVDARLEGKSLRLTQRRFFSDPEKFKTSPGGNWLVPVVIRFQDDAGLHEQRVLLRDTDTSVALSISGTLRWVHANGGSTGFYRVNYEPALQKKLAANVRDLQPIERLGLLSDQWALARVGARTMGEFLELAAAFKGETDYAVLDELISRLSALEHRLVADADRPALQRAIATLFGAAHEALGWEPAADEADETRLRRAALLRAVGLVARVPKIAAEAEQRYARYLESRTSLDANLADTVVTLTARSADATRFEDLKKLAAAETEPAAKRRFLMALANVESPALIDRAVEAMLTETVPLQEMAFYVTVLLGNRDARDHAWTFLRNNWEAATKRAGSPLILRRFIEALGALPERKHLTEVEAFLAEHPVEAAKAAVAQTLERLRLDVALRERAAPEIAAWLQNR